MVLYSARIVWWLLAVSEWLLIIYIYQHFAANQQKNNCIDINVVKSIMI